MSAAKKLDPADYLAHAPSIVGQQLNVNHEGCSAGKDVKKRLYVKRTDKGVLAYCHHCGKHGSTFNGGIRNYITQIKGALGTGDLLDDGTVQEQVETYEMPPDLDPTCKEAPRDILLWLAKSGVTYKELEQRSAGWSESMDGFVMAGNGWFQLRTTEHAQKKGLPRYLTYRTVDLDQPYLPWYGNSDAEVIVYVEDFLSALKVARNRNNCAIWLMGTNQGEKALATAKLLNAQGKQHVIMLDNDKPEVKIKAMGLQRELHKGCTLVYVADNPTDPKLLLTKDIEHYINRAIS